MKQRPIDRVSVEVVDSKDPTIGYGFDRFTTLEIMADLTQPTQAAFEMGDDGSWEAIHDYIEIGNKFAVYVNDRKRLVGRVELHDIPIDAPSGTAIRFTVRTKLADAMYASANPDTKVTNTTLRDFLLALYAPLGYVESDFVFDPAVARDLLTGRDGRRGPSPPDVEQAKEDQAKVAPPEAIFACADRHLRRFGLMHWDMSDGRICVGRPDDEQSPLYTFRLFRDAATARINNVLKIGRKRDYSNAAGAVGVFGTGGKLGYQRAKVAAYIQDDDIVEAGFYRPVLVQADGIATQAAAEAAAHRELSGRRRDKDTFTIQMDGLSYWNGDESIEYGIDTVGEVLTDVIGGPQGSYLIHRVLHALTPQEGGLVQLDLIKQGLWRLL